MTDGRKLTIATFAAALSFPAWADTTGLVVSVHDGDTMTVLVEKQQVKVRLAEIDAPELRQAFGNRSKQFLADLCTALGVAAKVDADTEKGGTMTLFIACLLIYNFQMEPWWYGIATVLWVLKLIAYDIVIKANVKATCHYEAP